MTSAQADGRPDTDVVSCDRTTLSGHAATRGYPKSEKFHNCGTSRQRGAPARWRSSRPPSSPPCGSGVPRSPPSEARRSAITIAGLTGSTEEGAGRRPVRRIRDVAECSTASPKWRLYCTKWRTFEDYCGDVLGMSKTQANRLIDAAEVIANLTPIGVIIPPANEAQSRPLAQIPPAAPSPPRGAAAA